MDDVYDPLSLNEPFGFLEIKCPYTHRNVTPMEASLTSGFCSTRKILTDGTMQLMAIGGRTWCDHRYRVKWPSVVEHGVTTGTGSNGRQW